MVLSLLGESRILVVVLAAATVTGSRSAMGRLWPATPPLRSLAGECCRRFRQDFQTRTRRKQWLAVLGWGAVVLGCHVVWLETGSYTRFGWLDLLAHAMGGAGVGALLFLGLRKRVPAHVSTPWLVLLTLAVGAGFEVYEYFFRSFWHHWSLEYYVRDTLVDLFLNGTGATVAVTVTKRVLMPGDSS